MIAIRLHIPKNIFTFFMSSLCFCIFYRLLLFIKNNPVAIDPLIIQSSIISFGLLSDLIVCSICAITLCILRYIFLLIHNNEIIPSVVAFIVYVFLVLFYLINLRVFSSFYIGINYTLLMSYFYQGLSAIHLLAFINMEDISALFIAIVLYSFIYFVDRQKIKKTCVYAITSLYCIGILYGAVTFLNCHFSCLNNRLIALYTSPIQQITQSFITSFNPLNKTKASVSNLQLHSVRLLDPAFINSSPPLKLTTHPLQQWNIVIFVLESVGTKYIFQPTKSNAIPMPFLKSLTKHSMWFENAYSAGNISALGQFGILTGIYPNPTPIHFEMRNDIHIPTIASWLGKSHDTFFVTASNNLYASTNIVKTFTEYDSADIIAPNKNLFFNMFVNEDDAFNFFKQRLNRANVPFVALYWSGATHYPYNNYHSDNLISTEIQKPYHRYLNNLRLLDQEIKQTYTILRDKHLLDRTIFVIVGDHGELFGQHDNLQAHGRTLYLEEIKIPLLIYATKLIKPRVVHELASSIDILPTLFDALNISHESQMQGISHISHSQQRKYVFVYGDEDEIAAIDANNMKMQVAFAENICKTYDLNNDPQEITPLPCTNVKQQEAILKFRYYQPNMLNWYNHLCSTNPTCS